MWQVVLTASACSERALGLSIETEMVVHAGVANSKFSELCVVLIFRGLRGVEPECVHFQLYILIV